MNPDFSNTKSEFLPPFTAHWREVGAQLSGWDHLICLMTSLSRFRLRLLERCNSIKVGFVFNFSQEYLYGDVSHFLHEYIYWNILFFLNNDWEFIVNWEFGIQREIIEVFPLFTSRIQHLKETGVHQTITKHNPKDNDRKMHELSHNGVLNIGR